MNTSRLTIKSMVVTPSRFLQTDARAKVPADTLTSNHAIVFRAVKGASRAINETPIGSVPADSSARTTMLLNPRPSQTVSQPTELLPRPQATLACGELFCESPSDNLGHFVRCVQEFALKLLGIDEANSHVEVESALAQKLLSSERCRHIFVIFKEALGDITHHAPGVPAALAISVQGTELQIEIRDLGRGLFDGLLGRSGGHGADVLKKLQARIVEGGDALELTRGHGGLSILKLIFVLQFQN